MRDLAHSLTARSLLALLLALMAFVSLGFVDGGSEMRPALPGAPVTPATSDLRSEIAAADSALFVAFNQRDLSKFRSFFARDLEFYQDNEGVEHYAQTMKDFGQMFAQTTPIRRELVAGSLEVYRIKDYGAIEVGRHRFCHVENGKEDCGTFSFVHIWQRTKTGWKIARVVSYGHEAPA